MVAWQVSDGALTNIDEPFDELRNSTAPCGDTCP